MGTNTAKFVDQIVAVQKEARELMTKHGLIQQGWRFELHNRKRHVGTCFHHRKVIAFSKYYLNSPPTQITDTILHEIAHALVGPDEGHNHIWKMKAREIGANPNRTIVEAVNSAKPNYIMKCPNCGLQWRRYRLRRSSWSGALCPDCHVKLEIYRVVK